MTTASPNPASPNPEAPPTTRATRARGVLAEKSPNSIVLTIPGTDYRLHLATLTEVSTPVGERIVGTIRLGASKRVDVVNTGGGYIEPLYGEPRRIQGSVVATDGSDNTITVNAVTPIVVMLPKGQRAADFAVGDYVSMDVRSNATFAPAG